ncbi:hypothetical protein [Tenacibaculum finnmarkense]|uniref:hypothetical protein n=1 Tax=Tenacibaculum finnmarkense TaxID=2781243 RepID=UPI00187BA6B6|nr:hypothetical protein [Tenacibaculum finnmarkense]MBE7661232.1 hypothetical protein [Tenacibaculum finnmarkense genomovar finnmarkense]MCG8253163.1 hypothetical protein [Tenacibaculum finnmarkense genomovar finnmarkense]MCG8816550.1 hypothetical protein [Tenacibaculum finnmarkense]
MTLNEILKIIAESNSDDWNEIGCWGYGSGPSYKDLFTFNEVYDGSPNILTADSHSTVSVYKKDLSITMAYGLKSNEDFKAEWANQFPDPNAHSDIIDIFYNNALVFRETYLVVDGGRCKLPIPSYTEDGELYVAKGYYEFVKFLEILSSGASSSKNFDSYFGQTGIKVIDKEWK